MTAEFESMVELLLVILTITCIVQVVFVGVLLWYMKRVADSLAGARAAAVPPPAPAAAVAGRKREVLAGGAVSTPAAPAAPVALATAAAPAGDLLGECPDIQASILRLCEKHDLADIIITTMDGLLVVSLSPGASEEAARYSDLYRRKKKPDTPGVSFLEMNHRGEAMLAIIRSQGPLTPDQLRGIGEDARKILNWWL